MNPSAHTLAVALVAATAGLAAPPATAQLVSEFDVFEFQVAPGPLADGLQQLADQTGLRIAYSRAQTLGTRINEVDGRMDYPSALSRMLVGTGLTWYTTWDGTVVVVPRTELLRRPPRNARWPVLPGSF